MNETTDESRSPAQVLADRVSRIVPDAIVGSELGPVLDFDLFMRMLHSRSIPFRAMNRRDLISELANVRDETHTQQVQAENAQDSDVAAQALLRVVALERRERQILDQLWPLEP